MDRTLGDVDFAVCGSVFPVFESSWITFGVVSGIMFYNPDVSWGMDLLEVYPLTPFL